MRGHNPWDAVFAERGRMFDEPHEDMAPVCGLLDDLGAVRVLDLGSGTGRHVVYLAERGYSVFGLDSSPEGIDATRRWLADEDLAASLELASMTDPLPYADGFFDGVVSVQVIHHADIATIGRLADEVTRVLRPGGLLFVTVPTLMNQAEAFEEIEPGTFVPLDGPEKGLPHHYFSAAELRSLFGGFSVEALHVDTVDHHAMIAFKRPPR